MTSTISYGGPFLHKVGNIDSPAIMLAFDTRQTSYGLDDVINDRKRRLHDQWALCQNNKCKGKVENHPYINHMSSKIDWYRELSQIPVEDRSEDLTKIFCLVVQHFNVCVGFLGDAFDRLGVARKFQTRCARDGEGFANLKELNKHIAKLIFAKESLSTSHVQAVVCVIATGQNRIPHDLYETSLMNFIGPFVKSRQQYSVGNNGKFAFYKIRPIPPGPPAFDSVLAKIVPLDTPFAFGLFEDEAQNSIRRIHAFKASARWGSSASSDVVQMIGQQILTAVRNEQQHYNLDLIGRLYRGMALYLL